MTPLESLASLVRLLRRDVTFHRKYPCEVQSYNPDGTVDVLPENEIVRGLGFSHVPIRAGLPDTIIEPERGAKCLLAFEAGDPRRPYVAAWSSAAPGIVRLGGGSRPVARLSDIVTIKLPPTITVTGVVEGAMEPPGADPIPVPAAPLLNGLVVVAIPPTAVIQTGNPKLLA